MFKDDCMTLYHEIQRTHDKPNEPRSNVMSQKCVLSSLLEFSNQICTFKIECLLEIKRKERATASTKPMNKISLK